MGIFINLLVSRSVTKEEWEKVYEETLHLVNKFPFADQKKIKIHGIDTICLVQTKEYEKTYGWHNEETRVGWETVGDYITMKTAENYNLPRDLVGGNEVKHDARDAMFGAFPAYLPYDREEERFEHTYHLWGAKTQGEPYHMYLLAVACLIEARLGTRAFIYGDITRGQCRKAVEIVNQHLEHPIEMPDRCYMDRLLKRVSKMPLSEKEKLEVFETFYLGTKDAQFGDYMRHYFSEELIEDFWRNKFKGYEIGMKGFNDLFNEYMLWGFDLEKLCRYVSFQDKEGNDTYNKFVRRVMDAKLHWESKNCEDDLKINQEEEEPYGIWMFMAQFAFLGAENRKVDRYIPIEEIRRVLNAGIGDKCNVNEIIDAYLAEEAEQTKMNVTDDMLEENIKEAARKDPHDVFSQLMDKKRKDWQEQREKFDINDYENLKFYEKGDTLRPVLMKSVSNARTFLDSLLKEEEYTELMGMDPQTRCQWLVEQNRYVLIRDKDWDKIFTDIEENEESFSRYYSIFRVKMNSNNIIEMCTALLLNDDLYAYGKELADQEAE